MSIIKQISSSIKTRKMCLEDKISYLEKLQKQGIDISTLPVSYVSKDGIIINNVFINIRKYYSKSLMTIEQIIRCENLGIKLQPKEVSTDFKINFLKKALNEGFDLEKIINDFEKYQHNSIYTFIEDLRNSYEFDELSDLQIEECINSLKIILPKEQRKKIALEIIRKSALKNITSKEKISFDLM